MNYPPPTGQTPEARQRHRRSDRYRQDGGAQTKYQAPTHTAYQAPAAYQPSADTPRMDVYAPPYSPPQPWTDRQAPPMAAQAARTAPKPAAKKKKKAKRKEGLSGAQWAILFTLLLGMLTAVGFRILFSYSLNQFRTQRDEEINAYQEKVANDLALQARYRSLIEQYAAQYGINPAYVSAIIMEESHYNPLAVSNKGARGLMQFMPDTFDWVRKNCGYKGADFDVIFQPEPAINMGCFLLKYIIGELGTDDPILVACAYHAGWGNVSKWVKNYSTDGRTLAISQIPMRDTRVYAERVIETYAIFLQNAYEPDGAAAGADATVSARPGDDHGRYAVAGYDFSQDQICESAGVGGKRVSIPDRADL